MIQMTPQMMSIGAIDPAAMTRRMWRPMRSISSKAETVSFFVIGWI